MEERGQESLIWKLPHIHQSTSQFLDNQPENVCNLAMQQRDELWVASAMVRSGMASFSSSSACLLHCRFPAPVHTMRWHLHATNSNSSGPPNTVDIPIS